MIPQIRRDATAYELFRALVLGYRRVTGVEVTVSPAATLAVQSAPHSLGRAYSGGTVERAGAATGLVVVAPPAGGTPDSRVYFQQTVATATTATLWVY